MKNKVYLVESSFDRDASDAFYTQIEGIYTDPAKAEELKLKVIAEINSFKDLVEPIPSMEGVWTAEECLAWDNWYDKADLAKSFNSCNVIEYTPNERIPHDS